MQRPGRAGNALPVAHWTFCILACICATCVAFLLANPVPGSRNSKHDVATLVVTNDGTFRNITPSVQSAAGLSGQDSSGIGRGRATRRQSKQVKARTVDISHWFKEDASDYPDDEIKRLLARTPEAVKGLFNVLNTQLDPHMNLTERVAFYNDDEEHGGGAREESVCRSVTRNIYPREAQRQNSLVYIPNNQEFMQVIQAEICQHPDRECSYLSDSLPYGMTSVCYQKYAYKKLLYFDSLDKRMASDLFRYPSCCSCYIRSLPLDLRSAGNATSPASVSAGALLLHHDNAGADAAASTSASLEEGGGGNSNSTATPASLSTNRSLAQQAGTSGREEKQHGRRTNQTVILSANKVFEANK